MLTLHEMARRDALEAVTAADLLKWRNTIKAKCLALIQKDFAASAFAQIGDLDAQWLDDHLTDALSDATFDVMTELES